VRTDEVGLDGRDSSVWSRLNVPPPARRACDAPPTTLVPFGP